MSADKQQKQFSRAEVRRTIATSLGAAFGFVIALVWSNVVMGGLKVAGVDLNGSPGLFGWLAYVITALVITIVMVVLIVFISRWGGKD